MGLHHLETTVQLALLSVNNTPF